MTPDSVAGREMLSSPVEAATGTSTSSVNTDRPTCESSADRCAPALACGPGTSETSFPSSRASRTSKPAGTGTRVTWAMQGRAHPMMKTLGLFMNMDRMVGRDFETGLANLKRVSEEPGLPLKPLE